jgi:hypothetical protein
LSTAALLLLFARPSLATLVQMREVQSFDLDTIRYTEHAPLMKLPVPSHTQSETLRFAPFDTSLGTLKNAYVSYHGTYGIQYEVVAGVRDMTTLESFLYSYYQNTVTGVAAYNYSFGLTASGTNAPLSSTIYSDSLTTEVHGVAFVGKYGGGMYYRNFDGSGPKEIGAEGDNTPDGKYLFRPWVTSGDLEIPLLDLSDGLNVLGDSVDIDIQKNIRLFMMPFFSSYEEPGRFNPEYSYVDNNLNKWSGDIALTYVYETDNPSPIPEPGTLLLLRASLLGLACGRRFAR